MRTIAWITFTLLLACDFASGQSIDAYNPLVPPTSISAQADGKILIVGNFQSVGTSTRNSAARLDADGSVDATFTDSGANGWGFE